MPVAGNTCIDPKDANAKINKYSTGVAFSDKSTSIQLGFEICQRAAQPNVTCWDFD